MSMLKFAYSEHAVVDVFGNDDQPKYNPNSTSAKAGAEQFKLTVAAAKRVIKKSDDFMYVRTRAIGSLEKWGPNMNGDAFPMQELASSYQTFIGKGNFIDHKSDDITKIRGLVIDAHLNTDDHCVECLIAVDRKSHPQLACCVTDNFPFCEGALGAMPAAWSANPLITCIVVSPVVISGTSGV